MSRFKNNNWKHQGIIVLASIWQQKYKSLGCKNQFAGAGVSIIFDAVFVSDLIKKAASSSDLI